MSFKLAPSSFSHTWIGNLVEPNDTYVLIGYLMLVAFGLGSGLAVGTARLARKARSAIVKANYAREFWHAVGFACFGLFAGTGLLIASNDGFAGSPLGVISIAAAIILQIGLPVVAYLRYRKAAANYEEAASFDQMMWRMVNGGQS